MNINKRVINPLVEEVLKTRRKKIKRRHYRLKGLDDLITFDLMELKELARFSGKYKYILVSCNPFNKQIDCVPLKTKSKSEVLMGIKKILKKSIYHFKNIQTDKVR